jgi:phenylacetic acid degradation operon negative regulatory protein
MVVEKKTGGPRRRPTSSDRATAGGGSRRAKGSARAAGTEKRSSQNGGALRALARSDGFSLQPQETILSLIGEYVDADSLVWSGGFVKTLNALGFSDNAARVALHRVLSRGLIVRVRGGRLVYYRVAERLVPLLEEGRRHVYDSLEDSPWDGRWTFVWYSIPEDQRIARRRLGRRLAFLGFGSLDDGTWVAPRDRSVEVSAQVRTLGVSEYVMILTGCLADISDPRDLAARAWDLAGLRESCRAFLKQFAPFASDKALARLQPEECFVLRTCVIDGLRQIVEATPRIPGIASREQTEAVALFDRLQTELAGPAKKYFLAAVSQASD